jgi:hypothetical protein
VALTSGAARGVDQLGNLNHVLVQHGWQRRHPHHGHPNSERLIDLPAAFLEPQRKERAVNGWGITISATQNPTLGELGCVLGGGCARDCARDFGICGCAPVVLADHATVLTTTTFFIFASVSFWKDVPRR